MKLSIIMGRFLRMLRKKSPYKQDTIPGVKVSTSTMSRVERNLTSLEVDHVEEVLRGLGIPFDGFVVACMMIQRDMENIYIPAELSADDRRKIVAIHVDSAIERHPLYQSYEPQEDML